MQIIRLSYYIHAPIDEVWKGLVDPTYIDGWAGGPAKMDGKVGTKFTLWGGDIHGTNKEVIKEKKLVQDWYSGTWKKASKATFLLQKVSAKETRLDLLHENVPDEEFLDIENGWKDYYLTPMKEFLEKKR